MEKMREEFEVWVVWCKHSVERNQYYPDDYKDLRIQHAWQSCKASRAARYVELP